MRLRPLSPLNQLYRYMSLLVNANSCEWIELDRPLDLDRLANAARHVMRRHPVLNSVQRRRGFKFYWKELSGDIEVDIRYEKVGPMEAHALHQRLISNVWQEQLPLGDGRPLRLHVTEAADGRTWLQIITTHVFTDGRSANVVARDLAVAYGGYGSDGNVCLSVQDGERDPFALFTSRLSFRCKSRLCWEAAKSIASDAITPIGKLQLSSGRAGPTNAMFFDLGQHAWERLKSQAQQAGLPVHPMMLCATLRTIEALNAVRGKPTRRLRIIDNFSLRRFAQHASIAELYDVLAVPYALDFDLQRDDEWLVRHIHERLNQLKSGEILRELYRQRLYMASSILSPKKLATRLVLRFIVRSNVICTNIGPVPEDFDAFGNARVIDYYSFSQMFPPGALMFLLSTYRSRLRLVVLYDSTKLSESEIAMIGRTYFPALLARVSGGGQGGEQCTEITRTNAIV